MFKWLNAFIETCLIVPIIRAVMEIQLSVATVQALQIDRDQNSTNT